MDASHRLVYLNTWFLDGGTAQAGEALEVWSCWRKFITAGGVPSFVLFFYLYAMQFYSARKDESFREMIELDSIIQSEKEQD